MEDTYRTQGIVLARVAFREDDERVTVYTPDRGKLTLVARGAKKLKSKLAAHIEPLCLAELMVVRGRGYDYLGAAASRECFSDLKNDFDKIGAAAEVVRLMNRAVKEGESDPALFSLLEELLRGVNGSKQPERCELLAVAFTLKMLDQLGYRPELYRCIVCGERLLAGGNYFDLERHGVVSRACRRGSKTLPLADDSVKILRLILQNPFAKILKLNLPAAISRKVMQTIRTIFEYQFN